VKNASEQPTRRRPAVRRGGAEVDPLPGTMLGEYQVEERLGEGGMSVVYRGVQPVIGKKVAIKVVNREFANADPQLPQRLIAEARAANAIRHRGIIDIFGFGQTPRGEPYLVMELLQGQALDAVLEARGQLGQLEALQVLMDLMEPLGAAHASGVIHRDLKPSNLFLVDQGRGQRFLKLLDFGLAKSSDRVGVRTTKGMVLGTPGYMAPEQIRGEPVSALSDLYSAGVVAFQLVAGRRPFGPGAVGLVLDAHLEKKPPRPSKFAPELHPRFESLILSLLEKEPSARPQSAEQVRLELVAIREQLKLGRSLDLDTSDTTEPAGKALPLELQDKGWKRAVAPVLRLFDQLSPDRSAAASRRALTEYRRAVTGARDANAVVTATLEALSRTFGAELAIFFLRNARGKLTSLGTLQTESGPPLPFSKSAVKAAAAARTEVAVEEDGRFILASPLLKGTQVGGVLYCHAKPGAEPFGAEDQQRLRALSAHAARALHELGWPRLG
jgi:serine/threonine protein kinase